MKKSRVCLNAPRSMILKILGNSSSSYKPPSVKKTLQLKDVLVTSSARRKELKEKQAIKDEKAEKKAVKDELKKQKLLKTTVSASQASKFILLCILDTIIVIIIIMYTYTYTLLDNNFKGIIIYSSF